MKELKDVEFKVVEFKDDTLTEEADMKYFYVPSKLLDAVMKHPDYTIDQIGNALAKKYGYEKARYVLKQMSSMFGQDITDEYEDMTDGYGHSR